MPAPRVDDRIELVFDAFRGAPRDDIGVAVAMMALLRAAGHEDVAPHGRLGHQPAAIAAAQREAHHALAAGRHLDAAIARFREAGEDAMIAFGLLARVRFLIQRGDLQAAETDLTESLAIARRIGLGLSETDAMLGFARLSLAAAAAHPGACDDAHRAAAACWQRAVQLITETGDGRRLADASLIEAEIAIATGKPQVALPALEAAAEAIATQRQFWLLPALEDMVQGFPGLASTLTKLRDERAACESEAGDHGSANRGPNEANDHNGQDGDAAGIDLATQVATVLDDPDLRRKIEGMLATREARATLARFLSDGDEGSLDDMPHEQQLAAMAAFLLSRPDDDETGEDADEANDGSDDEDTEPASRVGGQLSAAVEAILGEPQGLDMVDGLLAHPEFRRALIAELEASKVPVPLDQLPRDIQRKFAAAFALEKGVIAMKRGGEPAN